MNNLDIYFRAIIKVTYHTHFQSFPLPPKSHPFLYFSDTRKQPKTRWQRDGFRWREEEEHLVGWCYSDGVTLGEGSVPFFQHHKRLINKKCALQCIFSLISGMFLSSKRHTLLTKYLKLILGNRSVYFGIPLRAEEALQRTKSME